MYERKWIGKKGFDEAQYYTDEQDGIDEASEVNNDSTIKERILEAYQRSEFLKYSDIEVNVQEGHVKLKGRLQKKSDEAEAIDLAKTMSGVKSVECNQLYW